MRSNVRNLGVAAGKLPSLSQGSTLIQRAGLVGGHNEGNVYG